MQWVPVGILGKTHGLKGELKFRPDVPDSDLVDHLRHVHTGADSPEAPPRMVAGLRGHGQRLILKLQGVDRVEDARRLTGQILLARLDDFPRLPEGEYYWFQIQGLGAYDEDGRFYGTVEEIIPTGSNDVYVVRDGGRELLLPVIEDVIKQIDLDQHKLIFHAVEGLLEDHPL